MDCIVALLLPNISAINVCLFLDIVRPWELRGRLGEGNL
jgi:hypothetical protein